MRVQYKRMLQHLPLFLLSFAGAVLLAVILAFSAIGKLPKVFSVQPFTVGVYVEGEDTLSQMFAGYVQQMDSVKGLIDFRVVHSEAEWPENLYVMVVIPEKTAQSIMTGENIPVEVRFAEAPENIQTYFMQKGVRLLVESAVRLISVPQSETRTYYAQLRDSGFADCEGASFEQMLDLYHLNLVMERERFFVENESLAAGISSVKAYYLSAGICLVILLAGLGLGGFAAQTGAGKTVRERAGARPLRQLLLEKSGLPGWKQDIADLLLFAAPILLLTLGMLLAVLVFLTGNALAALSVKLVGVFVLVSLLAAFYIYFCYRLTESAAAGTALALLSQLAVFLCAGGVIPQVFLPAEMVQISQLLPAGVCLRNLWEVLYQSSEKSVSWGMLIGWCLLLFGASMAVSMLRRRRLTAS